MALIDEYYKAVKKPFVKLCRLRFLNNDNTIAFAIDNTQDNKLTKAFISDGQISVNKQNGQRRTASVTFENVDSVFDYSVNNLWFGTEIAIDEGLLLPDGSEWYRQQGVFVLQDPSEALTCNSKTISYSLVDKWANLDGTLYGYLESSYEIPQGSNIYTPIANMIAEDRGNGVPVDNIKPIFPIYYKDITQTLPNGSIVNVTDTPYTLTKTGGSTKADVILELVDMLGAEVGYNETGALCIEPSQEDISDADKPVDWSFKYSEATLLGLTYDIKNTEVYNDYIVFGEQMDDYSQPSGRAQNYDPKSDTNINFIGRKTMYESASGYSTDKQCKDLAKYRLKKATVLQKAVTISCSQLFHIRENSRVEIIRTDKESSPVEKHIVQGFTRPLASNSPMTINAVSVSDFPSITVTTDTI